MEDMKNVSVGNEPEIDETYRLKPFELLKVLSKIRDAGGNVCLKKDCLELLADIQTKCSGLSCKGSGKVGRITSGENLDKPTKYIYLQIYRKPQGVPLIEGERIATIKPLYLDLLREFII